jgi:crossover junction endodeoxyribonuclease RuvC
VYYTELYMKENILVAIDPGYDRCGMAFFSFEGALLYSTCIETNKKDTHSKRLHDIGEAFLSKINKWHPSTIAIETLFFSLNKKTALKVAEARGVILYLAQTHDLDIVELSPQTIKTSLTGVGNASKEQVLRMTSMVMKTSLLGKQDDEVDAIAIGLTAVQLHKTNRLFPIA